MTGTEVAIERVAVTRGLGLGGQARMGGGNSGGDRV